jgi:hypothetical protein
MLSVLREITEADLARLPFALPTGAQQIKKARAVHHKQAQLVAEGRRDAEIAAIVGCTAQSIHDHRKDPTFQDLVSYYHEQQVQIEQETHARVHGQLVDILELTVTEIQTRLEGDDVRARISLSELRKTAEFAADRTIAPPRATQGGSALPPARIELNFGFKSKAQDDAAPSSSIIDVTPKE